MRGIPLLVRAVGRRLSSPALPPVEDIFLARRAHVLASGFGLAGRTSSPVTNPIHTRWLLSRTFLSFPPSLSPTSDTPTSSPSKTILLAFGSGRFGVLGNGFEGSRNSNELVPKQVEGLPSDLCQVVGGHHHTLALTRSGEVWAWGRNREGQIGPPYETPTNSETDEKKTWNVSLPRRVGGLEGVNVVRLAASGVVSAAIADDGSLWVWGASKRGQLGLGPDVVRADVPTRMESGAVKQALEAGDSIVQVSLGWSHAMARTASGKLLGWGFAGNGRLGVEGPEAEEGADSVVWEPVAVTLGGDESLGVSSVACGSDHTLILTEPGEVYSVGENTLGQLGRPEDEDSEKGLASPSALQSAKVTLPEGAVPVPSFVKAGHAHCMVGAEDGRLVAWGWASEGQLGVGDDAPEVQGSGAGRNAPAPIVVGPMQGKRLLALSLGRVHTATAVEVDLEEAEGSKGKRLLTWGGGRWGRLGIGSMSDESLPQVVEAFEGKEIVSLSCGMDHTLVVVKDGDE